MDKQHLSPAPATDLDTDVLIVGAGPTGLTLAISLAQRGIRTVIIDRQAIAPPTSRAAVVHARTLEVLEPLGVTQTLVARGVPAPLFTIRDRDKVLVPISLSNLPTLYPYALMIEQASTERVLTERYEQLGGRIQRAASLVEVTQTPSHAIARLDDGTRVSARFIAGADGARSTVRELAQIPFTGGTYGESFTLADVRLSGGVPADEVILYFSSAGMVVVAPLPGNMHRIVATVAEAPERPDLAFVQDLLDSRGPKRDRAVVHELVWGSRFHVHHRIADVYRAGRLVLAGDAAHVHSPAGGQGMNAGILDAISLADALDTALKGDVSALDAYEAERRPAAHQVVALADRLTRLATTRPGLRRLRNLVLSTLATFPIVRRQMAWRLSGLIFR